MGHNPDPRGESRGAATWGSALAGACAGAQSGEVHQGPLRRETPGASQPRTTPRSQVRRDMRLAALAEWGPGGPSGFFRGGLGWGCAICNGVASHGGTCEGAGRPGRSAALRNLRDSLRTNGLTGAGREENCFAGGGGVTRRPIFPTPPPSLLGRRDGRGGSTQHVWLKMIPTSR